MASELMQIGEVAERTELSIRTVRHYDEVGLVRPSERSAGGFRLYTVDDVERLLVIRRMKPLGFTLEEMKDLLNAFDSLTDDIDPAAAADTVRGFQDKLVTARDQLATRLAYADELRGQLDDLARRITR